MKKLHTYLNSLTPAEQRRFAKACNTSVGYLRKALSIQQRLGERLCIAIERESGREVMCEDLRPDVDWYVLRDSLRAKRRGAA